MDKIKDFEVRYAKINSASPKTEEGINRLASLKKSTNLIFGTNF